MSGNGPPYYDRRADAARWSAVEKRLDALERTQKRILEAVEKHDGTFHDESIRLDERRKLRAERWESVRQWGSVIGYLGAAVALGVSLWGLLVG